jgi:hypothetical protein
LADKLNRFLPILSYFYVVKAKILEIDGSGEGGLGPRLHRHFRRRDVLGRRRQLL